QFDVHVARPRSIRENDHAFLHALVAYRCGPAPARRSRRIGPDKPFLAAHQRSANRVTLAKNIMTQLRWPLQSRVIHLIMTAVLTLEGNAARQGFGVHGAPAERRNTLIEAGDGKTLKALSRLSPLASCGWILFYLRCQRFRGAAYSFFLLILWLNLLL